MRLLDPMRPCRRCKNGTVRTATGPATCSSCTGTGQVPSARDQRRLNVEGTRRSRLLKVMNDRITERAGPRNNDLDFEVHQGYGLLDQHERHRMDALFDSLDAGRVDDVIDALIAYRNSRTHTEK